MIHIHWSVIVAIIISLLILAKARASANEPGGDYSFDILTPMWLAALVAFLAIWGGIFWW